MKKTKRQRLKTSVAGDDLVLARWSSCGWRLFDTYAQKKTRAGRLATGRADFLTSLREFCLHSIVKPTAVSSPAYVVVVLAKTAVTLRRQPRARSPTMVRGY